ncbi:MAG: hypothetical protein EAZ24_01575 [Burkholderiales bacterium]|nr:MAG: hypothetical protein EAZ24_01575 [Burkholderiales bacterium]
MFALDLLYEEGLDPAYGALSLTRTIQQYIENKLSRELLSGKFAPESTIRVDAKAAEIDLTGRN